MLRRTLRKNARRGAVAAEFALVAPVLMLLLVAVVDLTNQMNVAFDVQQAARDGALVGANTTLGPDDDGTVITNAAEQQAQQAAAVTGEALSNFKKAFSVCLEAKNYMVKF